jgi:mRNA-degrading endonuclease toxin of MazEF toxin-antitoxin module
VRLRMGVGGMPMAGVVKCDQLLTVSKERLVEWKGHLPPEIMDRVAQALKFVLETT